MLITMASPIIVIKETFIFDETLKSFQWWKLQAANSCAFIGNVKCVLLVLQMVTRILLPNDYQRQLALFISFYQQLFYNFDFLVQRVKSTSEEVLQTVFRHDLSLFQSILRQILYAFRFNLSILFHIADNASIVYSW